MQSAARVSPGGAGWNASARRTGFRVRPQDGALHRQLVEISVEQRSDAPGGCGRVGHAGVDLGGWLVGLAQGAVGIGGESFEFCIAVEYRWIPRFCPGLFMFMCGGNSNRKPGNRRENLAIVC